MAPSAEGPGMRACSACAGDYEDPDRTAWTADETIDSDGGDLDSGDSPTAAREEFPGEEL